MPSARIIRIEPFRGCQPSFSASSGLITVAESPLSMSALADIIDFVRDTQNLTSTVRRRSCRGVFVAFT